MSSSIYSRLAEALESDWQSIARPEQLPPEGKWSTWLILAGRGAGKTRTGAEWTRGLAEAATVPRIALVGPTAADVRDTMVEGESGILAICPNSKSPRVRAVEAAPHLAERGTGGDVFQRGAGALAWPAIWRCVG